MPRAPRLQEAGLVHHIVCRGNDRQNIFLSRKDFLKYFELLSEARRLFPVHLYNFCLMDNHLHLLLEPTQEGSLSKFMEHLSKGYAKYFNKTYNRTGHVFEGRFKSFIIQAERYFFACSRYIDLNPIKAEIVKDPKEYVWSGYSFLAYGKEGQAKIDLHGLYENLGKNALERQISYRALFNLPAEDLNLLDRRAGILGDGDFKERVFGLRVK